LIEVKGIGPSLAKKLESAGISTIEQIASSQPDTLAAVPGVSAASAATIIQNAQKIGPPADDPTNGTSMSDEVELLQRRVKKLEAKIVKLKKALAKSNKQQKAKSAKGNKKSKKRKKK